MAIVSRGFKGRGRKEEPADRVPPGQYLTEDFPVLSAGPTPRLNHEEWELSVVSEDGGGTTWTWEQFLELPRESLTVDIHCVTKWSKLDTGWEGVSVDTLLDGIKSSAQYLIVEAYDGYTTNLPLADVTNHKAWVAHTFEGALLTPEHGGPARLLVPHLYLWKSAKWLRRLRLSVIDQPGFWEGYGYHNYGDPWREQRYAGD